MMTTTSRWQWPAVALACALMAACGGGTEESSGGTGGGSGDQAADLPAEPCDGELSAAGEGVTEDEVAVGIMALDVEPLVNLGFAEDLGDVETVWRTFVDRANDNGGICGRSLVVGQYSDWDTLVDDDERRACVELTEDVEVLAVLATAGTPPDAALCVASSGATPLFANTQYPQTILDGADGRLFTLPPTADDTLVTAVDAYEEAGLLEGTVGVFYGGEPADGDVVDDVLLPELSDRGIEAVACRLPAGAAEPEGAAQLPLCIEQFESAGVDVLFEAVDVYAVAQGVIEGEAQGFSPVRLGTTVGGSTMVDSGPLFMESLGAAEAFDGAYGVSDAMLAGEGYDPHDVATECNEYLAEHSDQSFEEGTIQWNNATKTCLTVDLFVAAAEAAGGELTRERLVAGFESLEEIDPTTGSTGGLSAEDHGVGDAVRLVRYLTACACYEPEGDWVEVAER